MSFKKNSIGRKKSGITEKQNRGYEMKNIYEMYKDNELPAKLNLQIKNRQSFCKTEEEKIFIAGFMIHQEIVRIQETMGKDNWVLGVEVKGQ